MEHTKRLTVCAMMAAVSVVLMLLGTVLGLGTYAAPLLTGLVAVPVGNKYGRKYQVMLWLVVSVLCALLVPSAEQNLMYAGLFGWYPIAYPYFHRLPKLLRLPVKLLVCNVVVIAIEALVLLLLAPEAMEPVMLLVFLALWNVIFLLYDRILPKAELLLRRLTKLL